MKNSYIVPINLSRLGFRYFRIILESKHFSRKFIQHLIDHPNTGYVFGGFGWSGKKRLLGIGIWATNNAEIADIATHIRSLIPHSYKVVYQSELTRLEFFKAMNGRREEMVLIDELVGQKRLRALEIDYLKLLSVDGSLTLDQCASLLNISLAEIKLIDEKLRTGQIYYGVFPGGELPKYYTKFFIDTASLAHEVVEQLFTLLKADERCIYLARSNGKYNVEFEYILDDERLFRESYIRFLGQSKRVIFDQNIYTNLFPQSKLLNTKVIQDKFIELAGRDSKYFDFSDSELWYVNHEGVQGYLDIYSDPAYKKVMRYGEVELFDEVSQYLRSIGNNFNIIDLGSGDGKKGKEFIQFIGESKVKAYFPVDIQELELSHALHEHERASYAIYPTVLGFSKLSARFPLATNGMMINAYAIFGGTYGNFVPSQINEYLAPLLASPQDILLVSVGIRDHATNDSILRSYSTPQIESVAFGVLQQIGFDRSEFESNKEFPHLKVQLRWEDNRVRSSFTLSKHKHLFGLNLEPGTTFKCTSSWKPTREEFHTAISQRFDVLKLFSNDSFAIAVCKMRGSTYNE